MSRVYGLRAAMSTEVDGKSCGAQTDQQIDRSSLFPFTAGLSHTMRAQSVYYVLHEMTGYIANAIARNLRKPESGLFGFITKKILVKKNTIVEQKAVHHSEIKPHYSVLEVGFGPGIGLRAAYEQVKDGTGTIAGIDISEAMLRASKNHLKKEIHAGKIQLTLGSVDNMPYKDNQFDCVYHCNCYYFWPDINLGASELYRVMKPNTKMVTTMCINFLENAKKRGLMEYANFDPSRYMIALETAGFQDISLQQKKDKDYEYQVIFAHVFDKK